MPRQANTQTIDRRLSVAPMMERTDRFFRYFLRLLTRRTLLYTEMVATGAILHGDRDRQLALDPAEHPVAVQLGGAEPDALAACARIAEDAGFNEVNLNVGCPSDRVRSGRFGACLMAEPALVAECVAAMRAAVTVPVTVKSRIGIDDRDAYEDLAAFVATVAEAGCTSFAIHARKAWLTGLSPKQNREVPPLRYDVAARLKADFPHLEIVLNGAIRTLDAARAHLETFDGAMIGRAAVDDPYLLAAADRDLFGDPGAVLPARADVVAAYLPWMARQRAAGAPASLLVRPLIGLYHGQPGGRRWRQRVAEAARANDPARAVAEALDARRAAAAFMPDRPAGAAVPRRAPAAAGAAR